MSAPASLGRELPLLLLLALLWGSSYLFIKLAVAEIPPLTLIALRVVGAATFLLAVTALRAERLPRDRQSWSMLLVQAICNSIGAWTLLAWGQQYVDASLASVLNSTSPLFVFLLTSFVTRHEQVDQRQLVGALFGIAGVALIVGLDSLDGLGAHVAGQLACLASAALYGCAAIYGKRFAHLGGLTTAAGTMLWASLTLVPLALVVEQPWTLRPSVQALAATAVLSLLCTGVALVLYFRLVRTLGSMGVASQSYLRAGVGVLLGVVVLGERLSPPIVIGLALTMLGVALINWPKGTRQQRG